MRCTDRFLEVRVPPSPSLPPSSLPPADPLSDPAGLQPHLGQVRPACAARARREQRREPPPVDARLGPPSLFFSTLPLARSTHPLKRSPYISLAMHAPLSPLCFSQTERARERERELPAREREHERPGHGVQQKSGYSDGDRGVRACTAKGDGFRSRAAWRTGSGQTWP